MYFVKYGNEYLHDPRVDTYKLLDLTLDCEENSCGYCDFTIYSDHPMYGRLQERDADNQIKVYDDDILLFAGFIYELGEEFYLDGHVKCKGELEYLNESIIRPYSTLERTFGNIAPPAIPDYFAWLIEQHNHQVQSNKQFILGINQGSQINPGKRLFRSNDRYPKTIEEISEKLLSSEDVGGYLVVRHEGDKRYIDYLAGWSNTNVQVIDFGVNLTDYSKIDNAEEMATFVIPLGATISETEYEYNDGYFVTSDTVVDSEKTYYTLNDGSYSEATDLVTFDAEVTYYEYDLYSDESNQLLTVSGASISNDEGFAIQNDMVYNKNAVVKYGWIGSRYENSSIKTKEGLARAGIVALKEVLSPKRTIEIKAIDMHLVNNKIKPIRIGEYVRIRSNAHNLDSYFLCRSIELDLNNPEASLYTFGETYDTLTGQQNKQINVLNQKINKQYEEAKDMYNGTVLAIADATSGAEAARIAANRSIVSIYDEYAVSQSTSDAPQVGWSTTIPTWTDGTFIWKRSIYTYGDGSTAEGTPAVITGNSGARGEDATVLRIDSSRGTVFHNSNITTVLSVVIYHGSQLISNIAELKSTYGVNSYLQWSWKRLNEDSFGIILSSDPMISDNGFSLTLTPQDVDTKATFMCELIV